jgi:hypothetical protein
MIPRVGDTLDAYFVPTDAGLQPVPEARSPWAPDMLHGRLLAGLAARAVESPRGEPVWNLTRLTVDMFRSPPMTPIAITTAVVRGGRRVRVVDVSLRTDGVEIARASALLLRTGTHPPGDVWRADDWEVPHPDTLTPPGDAGGGWDIRLASPGGFWSSEQKRLWARDRWRLVADEEPTPVVRAALAADLPNPLANSSADGLKFINADLTMFLARPPTSDWIGAEVAGHVGHAGVAVGTCTLYDTEGAIGWSTVCAVTNTAALGE